MREELVRYASRMLGSAHDAEDVVQNAMLKAHRNGTRPDDQRAWMYSIVRNEIVDHLRRRRTHATALAELPPTRETRDPCALSETADDAERVARELARLPDPYREVLVLRFQQQLKFEEIASVLGDPLGTVKVHAARGLKLLRERVTL